MLEELQVKQKNHEFELSRLIEEVSTLHREKNDLQMLKNKELDMYRNEQEKNMVNCVQGLKSTYNNSKDIY